MNFRLRMDAGARTALPKALKKAGFKTVRDAWHAVRQALMTPEEVLQWSFPRPEGGGSKDPAAVFSWPRTLEDGFETLYSVARQKDQYNLREILGASYARDWKPMFHLIPKILQDEPIDIYRASDVGDILPGSYVSESLEYVKGHAERSIPGSFEIYSMKARPSELFTYYDPHEFLYIPESPEAWLEVARTRVELLPEWAAEELLSLDEPITE